MKIATLVANDGQTISFPKSGMVKVYQKEQKDWKVIQNIVFGMNEVMSFKEIRLKIQAMVEELGDCKIIVASEVSGIPFAILEAHQFTIWEMKGNPADYLEYIYESEEARRMETSPPLEIPAPVQNGREGCYYLDLKTIMQTCDRDKVTSKKILQPFLHNTAFTELEIMCDHIPHWFDQEFKRLNLQSDIEELGATRIKVRVFPRERG